jgi:hypothetical protein
MDISYSVPRPHQSPLNSHLPATHQPQAAQQKSWRLAWPLAMERVFIICSIPQRLSPGIGCSKLSIKPARASLNHKKRRGAKGPGEPFAPPGSVACVEQQERARRLPKPTPAVPLRAQPAPRSRQSAELSQYSRSEAWRPRASTHTNMVRALNPSCTCCTLVSRICDTEVDT